MRIIEWFENQLFFLHLTFTDTFVDHGINDRLHLCESFIDHLSDESLLVHQKSQIIHDQHLSLLLSFRYFHFGCKITPKTVLHGEHFLPKSDAHHAKSSRIAIFIEIADYCPLYWDGVTP